MPIIIVLYKLEQFKFVERWDFLARNKEKKKIKISGKLIFNILVLGITIYLIVYFFVSENGMIDLLSTPGSFNIWWIIAGLAAYELNILIDTIVTLVFIRTKYKDFGFFEALKVAFVGVFFGAITPSNTGGQPMQLYLMSKKNISVGFGSACMTQKFIVYQLVTTAISVFSIVVKFDYFKEAFTNIWSTLFIIFGFGTQLAVTVLFLIVSYSKRITKRLIGLIDKIFHKFKFVKNPDKKIKALNEQVELFHEGNKLLVEYPKTMIFTYILVFLQVIAILSVPYFVYLSLNMGDVAVASGQAPLNLFDVVCIQSFVLFTSNLVPLPGASGGAEIAFNMYFGPFFLVGGANKIKPAILLWRFITYYGAIIISAPFSYFTKGKRVDDAINELEEIEQIEENIS